MDYKQHNVTTYDIVRERSDASYSDFGNFDLIIGATGNQTVSHNYHKSFKKGAVLVNVASSDREFDAVYFRKLSGKKWNTHDDVLCNDVSLLNCGFPLNFSGEDTVSIPLKDIQLVCALLFLGVCESVDHNQYDRKFVELYNNSITSVVKNFSMINQEALC